MPLPTAVTRPDDETVASEVLDDDHVAALVTSWVVPLVIVAVAVNCEVAPTTGAAPVTATAETVLELVGESLHAAANTAMTSARTDAAIVRVFTGTSFRLRWHGQQPLREFRLVERGENVAGM